jgi:hypothetical protein
VEKVFASLGTHEFSGSRAIIDLSNAGADGCVVVDAIRRVGK